MSIPMIIARVCFIFLGHLLKYSYLWQKRWKNIEPYFLPCHEHSRIQRFCPKSSFQKPSLDGLVWKETQGCLIFEQKMSLIITAYEQISQVVKLGKSYLIFPSLLSDAVGSGQETLISVCNFSASTSWFGGHARIGADVSLAENTRSETSETTSILEEVKIITHVLK